MLLLRLFSLLSLVTVCQLLTATVAKTWYRPNPQTSWQYQLSGTINTSYDVQLYIVDLFDVDSETLEALHRQGRRAVCYFSAGSFEPWRSDAASFDKKVIGNTLEQWPEERWVDIRSPDVRNVMLKRLDLAKSKGCDAVEADNVDGYAHESGFPITAADQLFFNRFLANGAHERMLGIGLKNDLGQIELLVGDFDFAVNEECHAYEECGRLKPFIDAGKTVFNAEYAKRYVEKESERKRLCRRAKAMKIVTVFLPVELDGSFRYGCK
jgi:hypothetical protein